MMMFTIIGVLLGIVLLPVVATPVRLMSLGITIVIVGSVRTDRADHADFHAGNGFTAYHDDCRPDRTNRADLAGRHDGDGHPAHHKDWYK